MKHGLAIIFLGLGMAFGQDYGFKKGSKGNDYMFVRNKGITISIGPTWQFTPKTESYDITNSAGVRGLTKIDPSG